MLTTKFENVMMHENWNFSSFYFELSDIVNSSFNLREPIFYSNVVRKILRSLPEIFKPKVIAIKDSKDIDSMRIDELVGSTQTYEMTLPNSQMPKDFTFKASEYEEKEIEMPYNITKDELAHMAKSIKKFMKFNRKFFKNQEFRKENRLNDKFCKENDKSFSKSKKIE